MDLLLKKWREIANRITEILKEREWSQAELARQLNTPRSQITRLLSPERGGSPPSLRTIVEIEEALGEPLISVEKTRKVQ